MRASVRYMLAPDCPAVELIAADYGAQRFAAHWHLGFSIGVVTRSAQQFNSWGRRWVAAAGDLILLNPGQVHDGSALHAGGWSSRMAYVPSTTLEAFLGATNASSGLGLHFPSPVVHAPQLARLFEEWHLGSESQESIPAHLSTAAVLGTITSQLAQARVASRLTGAPFHSAIERCERLLLLSSRALGEQHEDPWSAEAMPRTTVWRHTLAQLGVGPQALRTHMRLVRTKQRLKCGVPIVEAALEAGYYDQAHFTRQFAAAYGMTPAQFRRVQGNAARTSAEA